MSLLLYWRQPPTPPAPDGGVGHPTKGIVAKLMWDADGSTREEATIAKGSPEYHYLRGIRDTHPSKEVRDDLAELLSVADAHGAVDVWTED